MYSLESFRKRSGRQKVWNGIPLSWRVTAKNKGRMFFRVAPVSCRIMLPRRWLFIHVVALFSRGNRTVPAAQKRHTDPAEKQRPCFLSYPSNLPFFSFFFSSLSSFLSALEKKKEPSACKNRMNLPQLFIPNNFNSFLQNLIVSSLLIFRAPILFAW